MNDKTKRVKDYLKKFPDQKPTLIIDGTAGAGKNSIFEELKTLGYNKLFDAGTVFRAITYIAREQELILNDNLTEEGLDRLLNIISNDSLFQIKFNSNGELEIYNESKLLEKEDLQSATKISPYIPAISSITKIREYVLQHELKAMCEPAMVMMGRNLAYLCSKHKISNPSNNILTLFLDANLDIRAARRAGQQLREKQNLDKQLILDMTTEALSKRDKADSERPLDLGGLKYDPERFHYAKINNNTTLQDTLIQICSILSDWIGEEELQTTLS